MSKIILSIIISIIFFLSNPHLARADYSVAYGSSALNKEIRIVQESDYRVVTLKKYLEKHNSPLSEYAGEFVYSADKYDIDWRLVPAISGVESTFGKRIPYGSYNAYGWANGKYYFESWEESIDIVSKTLREKYMNRGAVTIDQIGRRYAPPSSTWSWKVKYFMDQIEPMPLSFDLT